MSESFCPFRACGVHYESYTLLYIEEAWYVQKKLDMYRRAWLYIGDAWEMQKAIKTDGNNKTRQTKLNNYKR